MPASIPPSVSSSTTTATADHDIEKHGPPVREARHWHLITDQVMITDAVVRHPYKGAGTKQDPYVVEFIPDDPRDPMSFPLWRKWFITAGVSLPVLAVSFDSSAYTGGAAEIMDHFGVSQIVVTLGVSLFVTGFALGPLCWAPLSELYGRQYTFIASYLGLTLFLVGSAVAQNIQTLLIMRFFAGAFGSAPLTNSGGSIADLFPPLQRGLAMSFFAASPFLGPTLGPIVGGFVGETIGWRWLQGIMAIFTGCMLVLGASVVPETYAPVILRRRAKRLCRRTGMVYRSKMELAQGSKTVRQVFRTSMSRPWILLFREPIVMMLSVYMAIVYGTLYMCFGAFPIVYQEIRGWSQGIGSLSFLGVMIGMISAVAYTIFDNRRYARVNEQYGGKAPPEARLPPCLLGSVLLPIGLFWFAWTNGPAVHWIVSIVAMVPFGFGMVLVFLSVMNYLIDSYVIYAASCLAANSVLRSLFGAAFPLFTTDMYHSLGIHWASSIPAFLALACVPFPFLFYRYGAAIRRRCKYAAEAAAFLDQIRGDAPEVEKDGDADGEGIVSQHAASSSSSTTSVSLREKRAWQDEEKQEAKEEQEEQERDLRDVATEKRGAKQHETDHKTSDHDQDGNAEMHGAIDRREHV